MPTLKTKTFAQQHSKAFQRLKEAYTRLYDEATFERTALFVERVSGYEGCVAVEMYSEMARVAEQALLLREELEPGLETCPPDLLKQRLPKDACCWLPCHNMREEQVQALREQIWEQAVEVWRQQEHRNPTRLELLQGTEWVWQHALP
jgi:hypothetical protein